MARKSLIAAGSFLPAEDQRDNTPDLLERIVQKDAVKHGRRAETEESRGDDGSDRPDRSSELPTSDTQPENKSYDLSYGNMTSHTESNIPGIQARNTPARISDNTVGSAAGHTTDKQPAPLAGQSSLRATIQATIQNAGQSGEVLKTVTIKLAPSLDRRVEEHCFQTGRKKQEVVRDALLLYFEAVEEATEGQEG